MIIQTQPHQHHNATTTIQDIPITEYSEEVETCVPKTRPYSYQKLNDINNSIEALDCREIREVNSQHRIHIDDEIYRGGGCYYPSRNDDRYYDQNNDNTKFHHKRRVSFDTNEPDMATTINLKNYTEEEKEQCWYSKAEIFRIKQEIEPLVRLMKRGELRDNEEQYIPNQQQHCGRGLENRIPQQAMIRKTHKRRAWWEVFHEQYMQQYRGYRDSDTIARRYLTVSQYCAYIAHNNGLMDANYILNCGYLTTTPKTGMRKSTKIRRENHHCPSSPPRRIRGYEKKWLHRLNTTHYPPSPEITRRRREVTAMTIENIQNNAISGRSSQHLMNSMHYPPLTNITNITPRFRY
mmetsp:Transcript_18913/g.21109  ORF Transcript_18913/g.21109 Transcript_18913/m.21109 type:complete len:350 (+) Transcript_18913:148-1197(+)